MSTVTIEVPDFATTEEIARVVAEVGVKISDGEDFGYVRIIEGLVPAEWKLEVTR